MKDFLFKEYVYDTTAAGTAQLSRLAPGVKRASLEIPKQVLKTCVSDIGESAFEDESQIISVSIPDTIQNIQNFAFSKCKSLQSLNFSSTGTLLNIGKYAFANCHNFRHLLVNRPTTLNEQAFMCCKELRSAAGKFENVGKHAFAHCGNLRDVYFLEDVALADTAFYACSALETLTFAGNLIGDISFLQYVPETVKIICQEDSNVTELVHLGYHVETYKCLTS